MSERRLVKAVVFKAAALGSSLANVVVAGTVLDRADAFLYLAMLSTTQLMIPFAGFGIAQRLVRLSPQAAQEVRVRTWFLASAVVGWAVLAVQAFMSGSADWGILLGITMIQMLHIILAEWVRAGQARQAGFHIYNVALALLALAFYLSGRVAVYQLVLPFAGLVAFAYVERQTLFAKARTVLVPQLSDIRTSIRLSAINQFYNLIVVLLSFSTGSSALLGLVMVWRFNIVFNWQTFYWLRFGHKDLIGRDLASLRHENRKVNRLNWLACAVALGVVTLGSLTPLGDLVQGTAFDRRFLGLFALFAVARTAINLIFPFELFLIYTADLRSDMRFFALAGVTFLAIVVAAVAGVAPVALLLGTEVAALVWRLAAAREGRV